MNNANYTRYKTVLKLGTALIIVKLLLLAVAAASIWLDIEQLKIFNAIVDKSYLQNSNFDAEAEASDRIEIFIAYTFNAISLLSLILWFTWTFKSSKLARIFGADKMRHSAGSSIGWYFVPFANFIMPVLVMAEILQATAAGKNYRAPDQNHRWRLDNVALILFWWMFSLFTILSNRIAMISTLMAKQAPEYIDAISITLCADIASIPTFLLDIILILSLRKKQKAAFERLTHETTQSIESSDRFAPRYT